MKNHASETGFSIIELLLAVVALGLIGFAGNYVYQTNKAIDTLNPKANQTTAQTTDTKATITPVTTSTVAPATTSTVAPATVAPIVTPTVSTSSDLNTAQTTLDENDPTSTSSSDVAELDAELNSF